MNIETAINYIKNVDALNALFAMKSYTSELEKPCVFVGAKDVKIQQIKFTSSLMGDYSKETGYKAKDYSITWAVKTLTQDKGDQIFIDKMDDEEALAGGIVTLHNKYIKEISTPTIDRYRFEVMATADKITSNTKALTASNVNDSIIDAFTAMAELEVDMTGLILYVSPTIDGLLQKSNAAKGYISLGGWNGNTEVQSRLFNGALIKVVPSSVLGEGINFMLVHPSAVSAQKKFVDATVLTTTEAHGSRRIIIDEGVYHDCYVQPGGEAGIYVSKTSAAA